MKQPSRSLRRTALVSLLALSLVFASLPVTAYPVFDAANFIQNVLQVAKSIAQIGNQIIQIQNQITQLETMYRNLERLPSPSWRNLSDHFFYLNELTLQGEALSYAYEDVFGLYRTHLPGFTSMPPGLFDETYGDLTEVALDTFAATLDSASAQAAEYLSTQDQLAIIQSLADVADGNLEALNAGNMFQGHIAQEVAKLNQLQAASLNAETLYYGTRLSFEANQEATARLLIFDATGPFHVYTGHGGMTGIPPGWPFGCYGCGGP